MDLNVKTKFTRSIIHENEVMFKRHIEEEQIPTKILLQTKYNHDNESWYAMLRNGLKWQKITMSLNHKHEVKTRSHIADWKVLIRSNFRPNMMGLDIIVAEKWN